VRGYYLENIGEALEMAGKIVPNGGTINCPMTARRYGVAKREGSRKEEEDGQTIE